MKLWDRFGTLIVVLAILVLVVLRVLYLPPIPEKWMWTQGVLLLAIFGGLYWYHMIRKPRD